MSQMPLPAESACCPDCERSLARTSDARWWCDRCGYWYAEDLEAESARGETCPPDRRSGWRDWDDRPLEDILAEMEAKYGKKTARTIARAILGPLPPRKKGHRAKTSRGDTFYRVVGSPENPDAGPEAVDFRHHRARRETGKPHN